MKKTDMDDDDNNTERETVSSIKDENMLNFDDDWKYDISYLPASGTYGSFLDNDSSVASLSIYGTPVKVVIPSVSESSIIHDLDQPFKYEFFHRHLNLTQCHSKSVKNTEQEWTKDVIERSNTELVGLLKEWRRCVIRLHYYLEKRGRFPDYIAKEQLEFALNKLPNAIRGISKVKNLPVQKLSRKSVRELIDGVEDDKTDCLINHLSYYRIFEIWFVPKKTYLFDIVTKFKGDNDSDVELIQFGKENVFELSYNM